MRDRHYTIIYSKKKVLGLINEKCLIMFLRKNNTDIDSISGQNIWIKE